jgi:hypothetical protein
MVKIQAKQLRRLVSRNKIGNFVNDKLRVKQNVCKGWASAGVLTQLIELVVYLSEVVV